MALSADRNDAPRVAAIRFGKLNQRRIVGVLERNVAMAGETVDSDAVERARFGVERGRVASRATRPETLQVGTLSSSDREDSGPHQDNLTGDLARAKQKCVALGVV